MATQIVMSVDMLGSASPETDSGLAFSFKEGDYLCTKALDWLGLKPGEVHR